MSLSRIAAVQATIDAVGGGRYLELGVKDGDCFHAVDVETRVAVDPRLAFRVPVRARLRRALGATTGTLYYATTSDAFFRRFAPKLAPFSVVFVAGLHTYDQSYRDVEHALEVLEPGGVVVVHDCNPASTAAAAPTLREAVATEGYAGDWNGDVYKTIVRLRARDDLRVAVLDCDQGLGLVSRGVPETPLELSVDEIERLAYDDLARDRQGLLGLRPAGDLHDMLDSVRRHPRDSSLESAP
ncbi:MAG: class I SAM-dependent methyltransferase [Gaiella sp.]